MESAVLVKVQLKEADLRGAHLEGAYLWDADLRETDLRNAHLTATYLLGAKLQGAKILDPESLEEANGGHDTELGEGIHRPDWRGFLPGTNAPEPLHPVDYSIKVCKTLLYVGGLGAGWYSSLFLPYCLSLTPAEVYFTGSSINFCSGPWVCDPQKPKEPLAFEEAPKDTAAWVAWFDNHPYLRLTGAPDRWENPSGGASGIQFYVEVDPDILHNKILMGPDDPSVPFLPANPRFDSLSFAKGETTRIIILECEAETMLIVTSSPDNESDQFKDRVDKEVLPTMYIGA